MSDLPACQHEVFLKIDYNVRERILKLRCARCDWLIEVKS